MDNLNLQKIEGYVVQQVADKVWAIDEFGTDIIYLVDGTEKAAVIDTGTGFGHLKKVIEALTEHSYFVLNTHGHLDHAGGNSDFEEVYISEKDFFMIEPEYVSKEKDRFLAKAKAEASFYGEGYLKECWDPGTLAPKPLLEHQIFDLGGRTLEVLYTPGHTPGSVVFLDRENRLLFAGDSVVSTPILIFDTYSSSVQEFRDGLKRLDQEDFELIFPGHFLRPVGKKVLHDLITCAERILDGTATPEPVDFSHMSSEPAVLYRYGTGSIAYNEKHIYSETR